MTVLIQQRSGRDCVLASLAMATGKSSWDELWTQADINLLYSNDRPNDEVWYERAGLVRRKNYMTVYIHAVSNDTVVTLITWRRALISIHSLNEPDCNHLVYWDGERVWDPNEGLEGKLALRHLRSASISTVHILR